MKTFKITKTITNRESDSINKYFQEVNKISLLTKDEEVDIARKIKENNDQQSINKLVVSNLRFVISVAKQFQNQGLTLEDMINEGNIGLIIAANKFNYTKGFKFISYAVWWIRQSILLSIAEHSRIIRLPLNQINNIVKIKKIMNKLEQEHERILSHDEVSDLLNLDLKKVKDAFKLPGKCFSISEPIISGDSESYIMSDILENKESVSPDYELLKSTLTKQIENSLEILNDREKQIIISFFGLNDSDKMTLDAIGRKLGITRERTRQLKEKSIRKIRLRVSEIFE